MSDRRPVLVIALAAVLAACRSVPGDAPPRPLTLLYGVEHAREPEPAFECAWWLECRGAQGLELVDPAEVPTNYSGPPPPPFRVKGNAASLVERLVSEGRAKVLEKGLVTHGGSRTLGATLARWMVPASPNDREAHIVQITFSFDGNDPAMPVLRYHREDRRPLADGGVVVSRSWGPGPLPTLEESLCLPVGNGEVFHLLVIGARQP